MRPSIQIFKHLYDPREKKEYEMPCSDGRTKSDYRKGISRGRVAPALDRELHRVQLRIRGPRRVLAAGLCRPSTRDTSCTGYTGRTGWRFRSVQPREGPRDRRELLKYPMKSIVACSKDRDASYVSRSLFFIGELSIDMNYLSIEQNI